MKRLLPIVLCVVACSSPSGMDAGVDAGVDAGPTCIDPDAGPFADTGDGGDLSCAGQPLPAGAVPTIAVTGFVTSAGLVRNPVNGALVELFGASGALLSSAVSADAGRYATSSMVDCSPLDGYMKASNPDAGFYDAYYYPPTPWRRDRGSLELVIFDNAARTLISGIAGVTIQNGTAALAIGVDDCAGFPVEGAMVTTTPSGDVRYINAGGFPMTSLNMTSSKGQLLIFNVTPGQVQISASVGGTAFRTKTLNARMDAITTTTIVP